MSLKVVWPTRSRSGSQFVVKLTRSLYGSKLEPVHLVNGVRRDTTESDSTIGTFQEMFAEGRGVEYIRNNNVGALKYEDPGKDDFILELMGAFPNAKAVTSFRSLEKILISHYNIARWGHDEADVLHQFSSCLSLYKSLHAAGRLYMIDVESPGSFDLDDFASFLGVKVTEKARQVVSGWEPINTLEYQQEKHDGGIRKRVLPPRLERLRDIHGWIDGVESQYLAMCNSVPDRVRTR